MMEKWVVVVSLFTVCIVGFELSFIHGATDASDTADADTCGYQTNRPLSEALNAAVELPTFVIAPILLEKFNRRSSVLANCLVGGALAVFCFVLTLLGLTNIAFVFELGSFFCARIGFNLMAVYMIEMYPTSVRNFATTMLRLSLVLGGAACPIIASVGRNVPSLSFAVFGFTVLGLGLFTLFLPETKGASLCDTMEAQEQREQAMETSSSSC